LDAPDPADYVEPHDDDVHHDDHLDGWGDDGGDPGDHSDVEVTADPTPPPTPLVKPIVWKGGKVRRVATCPKVTKGKKKGQRSCLACQAKKGAPCLGSSSSAPAPETAYINMNQDQRNAYAAKTEYDPNPLLLCISHLHTRHAGADMINLPPLLPLQGTTTKRFLVQVW
jgi:hypothetical protein